MNKINYLSIAKTPYKISYAVFNGIVLKKYGEYKLNYSLYEKETYDYITNLVLNNKIDVVLTNTLDYETYMKKDIEKLSEFQTIIKLGAYNNNALYLEFKTYGWEKRILFNRITTKQKIETVNFGYDLDLSLNQVNIADAIILGEGVAHNRLQIGSF